MRAAQLLVGAIAVASARPVTNPLVDYIDAYQTSAKTGGQAPVWTKQHSVAIQQMVESLVRHGAPKLSQISTAVKTRMAPSWGMVQGYFSAHRRRLQFEGIDLATTDLSDIVAGLRSQFCSDAGKQGILQLVAGAGEALPANFPPIEPLIDTVWPCICTGFQVGPELNAIVKTVLALFAEEGTEPDIEALVEQVKRLVVELFGPTSLCVGSCQAAGKALIDFGIEAGAVALQDAQLLALAGGAEAVGFIPSPTTLRGLGKAAADCTCSGFKWQSFMNIIDYQELAALSDTLVSVLSDPASVLETSSKSGGALSDEGETDTDVPHPFVVGLESNEFKTAVATIAKYPDFLISSNGGCAAVGCQAFNQLITNYVLELAKGLVGEIKKEVDSGESAEEKAWANQVVAATAAFQSVEIVGCFCGGTISFDKTFAAVADIIPDAATAVLAAQSSGWDGFFANNLPALIGASCSAIFSPTFLCSNAACAAVTADTMVAIGLAGQPFYESFPPAYEITAGISGTAWCPTPAAEGSTATAKSGAVIKQAFTITGTVSDFDDSKRDNFKKALVNKINSESGSAFLKVTPAQVTLTVTAGSVNVEAAIAVSSPTLVTAVKSTMTAVSTASPAELTATFGSSITIEAVAAPAEEEVEQAAVAYVPPAGTAPEGYDGPTGGGGGGGDDNTLIIVIAAAAGAVVLLLLVIVFMMKKSRDAGTNAKV